jgi:hypothetical protein
MLTAILILVGVVWVLKALVYVTGGDESDAK